MSEPEDPADTPDEIAVVADGIDEYIDKARYKMLFDARQEAAAKLRSVPDDKVGAQNSMGDAGGDAFVSASVRAAVNTYIHEAEPLFRNTEVGTAAWEDAGIASVPLESCIPDLPVESSNVTDFEAKRLPEGVEIHHQRNGPELLVRGVGAFTEFDGGSIHAEWEEELDRRNPNATKSDEGTVSIIPTVKHSRGAFRATNALLSELGVGLEAETEEEKGAEWTSDYRDEE